MSNTTIESQDLIEKLNEILDNPYSIEISSENYYVGVYPEILNKSCKCRLSLGKWTIYDYYDHRWSLFGIRDNKASVTLKLDRKTEDASHYGFLTEETVNEFVENYDEDDNYGLEISADDQLWTFGRGDDEMLIYNHKNNGIVDAFFITNTDFLDLLNELDDQ